MTRPPQLPPLPPPEPLDAAERTLARALRNLPSGAPPPELDARILGAARRAVHLQPPRRRDRRWIIGLSTAATALLAMGVLLKMHGLDRNALLTPSAETEPTTTLKRAPSNAPAESAAAASAVMQDTKKDTAPIAADAAAPAGSEAGVASAMRAPPRMEESARAREQPSTNSDALAAKQAPRAFPAEAAPNPSSPAPIVLDTATPMAAQAPPPPPAAADDERKESDATESGYARRNGASLSTPAPAAAVGGMLGTTAKDQATMSKAESNAMQSNAPVPQQRALDKVNVVGARQKPAGPARTNQPALSDDAKLGTRDWIERIRERLHDGDRAGATSSLQAFLRTHPEVAIPDDLQPLLH